MDLAEDSGFARGGGLGGDSGFARELSRQSFLHSCAMIRVIIVSLSQLGCPTFVLECVCVRVCACSYITKTILFCENTELKN